MTRSPPLEGRTALVTGASRGIGEAVARRLAEAGAAVLLVARGRRAVENAAARLESDGHRASAASCDVTDAGAITELAALVRARLGHVDVLVNSAGIASSAPVQRQSLEEWQRLMAVNATGTFLCTQAVLPGMLERAWGRIINVASVAGLAGAKYIAAYTASKHAVVGFTRALAAEVAGTGVTANAVCPGYVDTELTTATIEGIVARTGKAPDQALAAILATTGQHRLIQPNEVAHAVLCLCHVEAQAINGQTLVVDGGALLS